MNPKAIKYIAITENNMEQKKTIKDAARFFNENVNQSTPLTQFVFLNQ